MDCSRVRRLLEEHFEGVLPSNTAADVRSHLSTCPHCASELQQIQRIAVALEAVPRVAPAADLLQSISLRTAQLPAPATRRTSAGWRWLAVVAALSVTTLWLASYLLPLLISEGLASNVSLARFIENTAVVLQSWFGAVPGILVALWGRMSGLALGCGIAARAVAPTLGIYAAAEIGILLALVLVLHASRRKSQVHQTLLV